MNANRMDWSIVEAKSEEHCADTTSPNPIGGQACCLFSALALSVTVK